MEPAVTSVPLNEVLVLNLSEEHIASILTHIAFTLKIETLCSIEMLVATYENIGLYNPKYHN